MAVRRASLIAAALPAALAGPAAAQSVGPANPNATPIRTLQAPPEVSHEASVNGVLTLYGDQRCPTDRSGNEVVVCVRRSAAEQFRIPKQLREFKVTPQNESWARTQSVAMSAGAAGTGSCTTVGAGGGIGCFGQETRIAKAETKQREKDATPDLKGY
ncbi:hypothetical protein [Sphingomonas bacterium]|uniref:hypothetical protein n=1 Tax=Sphingomonas bacterium TaxID=1895847 RepID=UPI001576F373|nr:hypothetical protein [Sphingomonas bacterium]